MRIEHNRVNNTYRCYDGVHWFPQAKSMYLAIVAAFRVMRYWSNVEEWAAFSGLSTKSDMELVDILKYKV